MSTPRPIVALTRRLRADRAAVAGLVMLLALLALLLPQIARAAEFPPPPTDGSHIADYAGVLTETERADLEARAAAVEQAGAPVTVFLQAKDASYSTTEDDARTLMDEWDVQSAAEARDGIVIMLNLDPDNLRRGELVLVAGERHFNGGNLPQHELDRITDAMLDELRDDQTAAGIGVGLDMLASSLINGPVPQEPSAFQEFAADAVGGPVSPLNIASVLAGIAAIVGAVVIARPRLLPKAPKHPPITTPPSPFPPAVGGALGTGTVGSEETLATLLDLAARGVFAIESEDDGKKVKHWWDSANKARINLRDLHVGLVQNPHEAAIVQILQEHANEQGYVDQKALGKARSDLDKTKDLVTDDLVQRGLWDPSRTKLRNPLYLIGTLAGIAAFIVFMISGIGEEIWGIAASGVLLLGAVVAFGYAISIRSFTAAGEEEAARWRAFAKGLKQVAKQPSVNLDRDFPWAVAMSVATDFDKPLRKASKEGYAPVWLGQTQYNQNFVGAYFIYASLSSSVAPSYSGSGAGAASAGSGSSGGSF